MSWQTDPDATPREPWTSWSAICECWSCADCGAAATVRRHADSCRHATSYAPPDGREWEIVLLAARERGRRMGWRWPIAPWATTIGTLGVVCVCVFCERVIVCTRERLGLGDGQRLVIRSENGQTLITVGPDGAGQIFESDDVDGMTIAVQSHAIQCGMKWWSKNV